MHAKRSFMISYRPDIDGLRAVAVVAVVLFHARVPGFTGGYVGVDVFFVISGYLITALLTSEIKAGRFSLLRFYERRVRRLWPALLVVLAAASIVAWYVLLPDELKDYGQSLAAAVLFVANILFYIDADYFAGPAETKPLLHTWSLAVEEQFYIFFPPLLWLLMRRARTRTVPVLAVAWLVSLAACLLATSRAPEAAFYLAPFRAWELLSGALLALGAVPPPPGRLRPLMAPLGLGLILLAVFAFTATTPFPGAAALLPCLGTALVVHAGGDGRDLATRLLLCRPIVFVGLVSYSLYLWHWPVLVFGRLGTTGAFGVGATLAASFALAVLSWRFVERPFRRKGALGRRPLFAAAAVGSAVALAFGIALDVRDGVPARLPEEAVRVAAFRTSMNPDRPGCLGGADAVVAPKDACTFGAEVAPSVALWGDSHADVLLQTVAAAAAGIGRGVAFHGYLACPPLVGLRWPGAEAGFGCLKHNDAVLGHLASTPTINTVILAARWPYYVATAPMPGPLHELLPPPLAPRNGPAPDAAERAALFAQALKRTIKALLDAGKRVVLLGPVPETGSDTPAVLARLVWRGDNPAGLTAPRAAFMAHNRVVLAAIDALPSDPRLTILRPDRLFCDPEACRTYQDGVALYRDQDHLSLEGAARLRGILAAAMRVE